MKLSHALGHVLKLKRNQKGLNQIDVAVAADTSRSFISDVENGKRNISMDTFIKLCNAFEADPREIFNDALNRMER